MSNKIKQGWAGAIAAAFVLSAAPAYASDNEPVIVFENVNFRGDSFGVGQGAFSINDIRATVGNDRISSIRVAAGYSITACRNSGMRGTCITFTNDR